ncbi:MAG TPA: M56 family metallopeptidase [Puia sp.]|nr:M56 family metallopeptidase [Puia sp.]
MHLLNDEIMKALCWTLIHSLWQGLLLAIIGGAVILFTKRSNSVVRYNSLSVLFFLFVAAAYFTFTKQLQLALLNNITTVQLQNNTQQFVSANANLTGDIAIEKTDLEIFVSYFNEHASLIVTIWFIILSAQFIKLIANVGYVQRIKHYKTHAPTKYWTKKMQELAEKLQIKQRVLLLQSEIVKVPVMVGFLKPVILFPFSMMMQLPAEQVEAVLLHELAHIKRKDYFINLLQNFAEIIFFFNPGVLWISSLIRDERENCCDDIAIDQTNSRKEFIHALVSFQEYNLERSKYALAFPGRKNHLLNRIKRILTKNNKTLNNMEKISLATGIVIIGFATIAFTQTPQKQEIKNVPPTVASQKTADANDTIPDEKISTSKFTYVTTIDGKEYKAHIVNDKLTKLYIDGKKVPDEKLGDYKEITERIIIEAKADQDKFAAENRQLAEERVKLLAEQDRMQDDMSKMSKDTLEKVSEEKAELDANINEALRRNELKLMIDDAKRGDKQLHEQHAQLNQQNAELMALVEELRKQQEIMKQEAKSLNEKDSKKQTELLNKQILELKNEQLKIEQQRKNINEMMLNEDRSSLSIPTPPSFRADDPISPLAPLHADLAPLHSDLVSPIPPIPPIEDNKTLRQIISALMDRKIISSKNELSIVLNDETFIVNDVTQPEKIHAEFKDRYITSLQDHVIYSKHGGSTHVDINLNSGTTRADLNENK